MAEQGNPEPEDAAHAEEDLWQVRVAADDIRAMTFEQLEKAFFSGLINADTSVLDAGATEWKTLREIAGRDTVEAPLEGVAEDPAKDPPIASDDVDAADYELKLVDFRVGQRKVLAIAAAAAVALGIVIACAVSFDRRPQSLPTPWLDAPARSLEADVDRSSASLASPEATTDVGDTRSAPRPASTGVVPATGHRARGKLFHP